MKYNKNLMADAAVLYYEKNLTQTEIAKKLNLTRQTVSKLLNDAVAEKIVEIKINKPIAQQNELAGTIKNSYKIENVCICSPSNNNESIRALSVAKAAVSYITPLLTQNKLNIGISWGKTIMAFLNELSYIESEKSLVFPLFGATDCQEQCYLSNELARLFADKTHSKIRYAWFPFKPESEEDCSLFKRTAYYKNMEKAWDNIDIAIVGIGSNTSLEVLGNSFGDLSDTDLTAGDIATHTYNIEGEFLNPNRNTLCIPLNSLKKCKNVIAIAYGEDKVDAITGALRCGIINTLITDDYTAKLIAKQNI